LNRSRPQCAAGIRMLGDERRGNARLPDMLHDSRDHAHGLVILSGAKNLGFRSASFCRRCFASLSVTKHSGVLQSLGEIERRLAAELNNDALDDLAGPIRTGSASDRPSTPRSRLGFGFRDCRRRALNWQLEIGNWQFSRSVETLKNVEDVLMGKRFEEKQVAGVEVRARPSPDWS